jgi:broad specificity phosphatase PhoE
LYVNYELIGLDKEIWWYGDGHHRDSIPHEPLESVYARIAGLRNLLATIDADVISVVCHGNFIKTIMGDLWAPDNCSVTDITTSLNNF